MSLTRSLTTPSTKTVTTKTVVVIIENDVLELGVELGFYLGRSGDFTIINHFFEDIYKVVISTPSLLIDGKFLAVESINFEVQNAAVKCIFQEYQNIVRNLPPSMGENERLLGKIIVSPIDEVSDISLLISRVMPQSLTHEFLAEFNKLAQISQNVPQNMEDICLYKDKVIPYLLQNNEENIAILYATYSPLAEKFCNKLQGNYNSIAMRTSIVDISHLTDVANVAEIDSKLRKMPLPVCVKPFNLFGGIGVGVFDEYSKAVEHFHKIDEAFTKYQISKQKLVLIQQAVKTPEFGDIRVIFSHGKFLGAFKRYEPIGKIHNTINGARIVPVCDANLNFSDAFELHLQTPFTHAITQLQALFNEIEFLKTEFICGCDFLLDGISFKLTEINIACPTGLAFLEASLLYIKHGKNLTLLAAQQRFAQNCTLINFAISNITLQHL